MRAVIINDMNSYRTGLQRYVQSNETRHFSTILSSIMIACNLALILIIAIESLVPTQSTQSVPHLDKFVHFSVYCGLAIIATLAFPRLAIIPIIGLCSAYGITIEILQGTMAIGRTASIADGIANILGAIVGAVITHIICRKITTNIQSRQE